MARNGKIARLPREVRAQLNSRLDDGLDADTILPWLNALPEVKSALAQHFDGRSVSPQNISEWRNGGFQEWLACRHLLEAADELAANQQEIQAVTRGGSLADHLANAIAFRLATILSAAGPELDEKSIAQLRALYPLSQVVVKMRRSEMDATCVKIKARHAALDLLKKQDERDEYEEEQERKEDRERMQDEINRRDLLRRMADPNTSAEMAHALRNLYDAKWGEDPAAAPTVPTPASSNPPPPAPTPVTESAGVPTPETAVVTRPVRTGADRAAEFIKTALEAYEVGNMTDSVGRSQPYVPLNQTQSNQISTKK